MMPCLIDPVKVFKSGPVPTHRPGEVMFQSREQGTGLYGILEGAVTTQIAGQTMEMLTSADVFGIGALVQPEHLRA